MVRSLVRPWSRRPNAKFPVRADATRRLVSTTLAISDITGLQSDLTSLTNKTQNITEAKTAAGSTSISGNIVDATKVESVILSTVQTGSVQAAQASCGILYSDLLNQLHYTTIGGGDVVLSSGVDLPLSGGTMSGPIAMATNNITNIGSISGAVKALAHRDCPRHCPSYE